MSNLGKQFELKFKEDFSKIPESTIDRIYDVTTGYKSISNVCDFICYKYPNIFYIECKSHKGASFPFVNLTQYSKLKDKVGIKGVRAGVILWLYEKDLVLYVPINTISQMMTDDKKSVGIRDLDKYNIIKIPSIKKRVFMDSDYSVLLNMPDGN